MGLDQKVGWVFGSESGVGVWVREWGGCLGQRVGWVFGSESGVGVWVRTLVPMGGGSARGG